MIHEGRNQEMERLRKLVRELELEVRGRRRRGNRDESPDDSDCTGKSKGESFHQSSSRQSRERLSEIIKWHPDSPNWHRHHSAAMDVISQALRRATQSPFSNKIERTNHPPFISYNGKTDPIKHVGHYIQMMSLHSQNDALICKVFPSSLGPTVLRWFNGLKKGSIHSFGELIQEFRAQFITCSRVPQPIDALLSMEIGTGETLQNYAKQYWELYNEIGCGNEKVATSTFRLGLSQDFELGDSLTMQPPESMHQLLRQIEEYKRLEDDRQQSKCKALATSHYVKDSRPEGFQPKSRKEIRIQEPNT